MQMVHNDVWDRFGANLFWNIPDFVTNYKLQTTNSDIPNAQGIFSLIITLTNG